MNRNQTLKNSKFFKRGNNSSNSDNNSNNNNGNIPNRLEFLPANGYENNDSGLDCVARPGVPAPEDMSVTLEDPDAFSIITRNPVNILNIRTGKLLQQLDVWRTGLSTPRMNVNMTKNIFNRLKDPFKPPFRYNTVTGTYIGGGTRRVKRRAIRKYKQRTYKRRTRK